MHRHTGKLIIGALLLAAACVGPLGSAYTVREGSVTIDGLEMETLDPQGPFYGSNTTWSYDFDEESSEVREAEIGGGTLAFTAITPFVEVILDASGASGDTTWTSSSIRLRFNAGGWAAEEDGRTLLAEGTDLCTVEVDGLRATFDCEGVPVTEESFTGLPDTIDISGELSSRQIVGGGDE